MWTKRAPAALVAVSSGPRLFSLRRLPGSLPSLARAQPTYVAHCVCGVLLCRDEHRGGQGLSGGCALEAGVSD
jgi:hypothetical protein